MSSIPTVGAMTGSKERRAEKAKRILNRNNAQEIIKALRDLEERRPEFATRWLWELMQNARDFPDHSRPMVIKVKVSQGQIHFAHNGRAFSEDEILSLIYHGSTKEDGPLLGKFGTGFLSTHLLSRKVRVRSTLVEETGEQLGFEFALDRSGADASEVGDAMERSVEAFERALSDRTIPPSEWTEYIYDIADANPTDDAHSATRFQLDAIPYVLAFDENINTIDIDLPQLHCVFKRQRGEQLSHETTLIVISNGGDVIRLALLRDQEISVAVPIRLDTSGKYEVMEIGAVPKLFVFLPLVGSSEIGLPAAFHSRLFEPVEARDGLHLEASAGTKTEANKRTLSSAASLLQRLAESCSALGCGGLQRLLRVHFPQNCPSWLGDKSWYRQFEQDLARNLANLPLVCTKLPDPIPATQALLPVGDARLSWERTFEFSFPLFAEKLPDAAIAEECARIASDWMILFEVDEPLRKNSILSSEQLFSAVRKAGGLVALSSLLAFEIPKSLAWLNQLILAVPEDQRRVGLDGLVPDQTSAGTFRTFDKLVRDKGIDENLKNILENLGDPIRERLLHSGVVDSDRLVTRLEKEEALVSAAKDLLKKRLREESGISAPGTRAACLSLFGWFAERARWIDLKDSMPVITLDRDGNEMLAKTSDRASQLLISKTFWPENAKRFWNAFPPGSVLVDDYALLLDPAKWEATTREGIVLGDLIWSEKTEITDVEQLSVQLELEGEGHASKAEVAITKMAFVGSEFLYESLRKNRERAARFLLFVLEYAALADDSWRRQQDVPCECGKTHTIIPSHWLAWIRRTQWIPRRSGTDHLTTESLARLAQENREIAEVVTRKELEQFLEIVGVNVLEQALLATDPVNRAELRRSLAQLAKLASQNPGEVEQLIESIENRRKAAERWESNRFLGNAVEQLVGAMLRAILRDHGIRVETNFVGYDLAAYYEGQDSTEEEVGCIHVSIGTLLAKIEIKATRGRGVSMSYAQGLEATNDRDNYWLCVVPLPADQFVSTLDASIIEKLARFVPMIGDTLAVSRAGIDTALQGAAAGGFELQHVEEIRYGISHVIWENSGILLKKFVETLARRVMP